MVLNILPNFVHTTFNDYNIVICTTKHGHIHSNSKYSWYFNQNISIDLSIIDTEIWINNKNANIAMLRFEVDVFNICICGTDKARSEHKNFFGQYYNFSE